MFKKLMATLIICCTFNAYGVVQSSQVRGMNAAFDNLNYALEVEWDGVDQTYLENQKEEFKRSLQELQQEGLTKADIIETLISKIKNKRIAGQITDMFEVASVERMTDEEVRTFVMNNMADTYTTGADFTGGRGFGKMALICLIIIAIIVAVVKHHNSDDDDDEKECYDDYSNNNDWNNGYDYRCKEDY